MRVRALSPTYGRLGGSVNPEWGKPDVAENAGKLTEVPTLPDRTAAAE